MSPSRVVVVSRRSSACARGADFVWACRIWAECSGANEAREPGLYQELLAQHKSEENQCLNQIDMDCESRSSQV